MNGLHGCQNFALFVQAGSVSGPHIDHRGAMTWITLEKDGSDGSDPLKIWAIANWDGVDSEVKQKELKMFESGGEDWSPEPVKSRRILRLGFVEAGDTLIMPPGTIHAPITVTDSAISGGMCWPPWLMRDVVKSFKYMVEHETCTNEPIDVRASGIFDQVLLKIAEDPEHFAARGSDGRLAIEKDDLQCLLDEIIELQRLVEKGCKCGKKLLVDKCECEKQEGDVGVHVQRVGLGATAMGQTRVFVLS